MLTEELLKTILDQRARELAEAQRVRAARGFSDEQRHGRSWFQHLSPTPPRFGGRPHPGKPATESL